MAENNKVRMDKYLWSIRLFKTRGLASEACDKGRVKNKGLSVKAAKPVILGEQYEIRIEAIKKVIQVTGIIDKRVAYSEAILNYIDLTPAEELEKIKMQAASFHTGKRQSKIGRPTKKERRALDDFQEEEED